MQRIISQETIQILKERCDDLRKFYDTDVEKIQDSVLKAKIEFKKKTYELNKRLLDKALGREAFH